LKGDNIWNICILDNIDFKQKQFTYDNIYDKVRQTAHATLCIVFQFTLPKPLTDIIAEGVTMNKREKFRVGVSSFVEEQLMKFKRTIKSFLDNHDSDSFETKDILMEIRNNIRDGCVLPTLNVVILEPGNKPSCNENVHEAVLMYYNDVGTGPLGLEVCNF